jgi:hypothetical protein
MVGTSKSGNRFAKEHGLLLFLPPELILALAKVQIQKEIGRSYAGLYALTVGFHQLGAISKEQFEVLEKRYSEPLMQEPSQKPLSPAELLQKQKLQAKDRYFLTVLAQWTLHKDPKWRQRAFAEAEKFRELESAKRILALRHKISQEASKL